MIHIDLFSGIGGFALALDNVYGKKNIEHIFCDNDLFCQEVLKKQWPEAPIYSDIRTLTANAERRRYIHRQPEKLTAKRSHQTLRKPVADIPTPFILTGGFPCQPFSQAGRRKGTNDDRYLWPEMFRVIREFRPTWIIAENVRGLLTWNEGMVLEQVCADLERESYEVQPLIVPAVSVNAPHRRDRVWFIANAKHKREGNAEQRGNDQRASIGTAGSDTNASYSKNERLERGRKTRQGFRRQSGGAWVGERPDWGENWIKTASRLCRVDDGVPKRMDRNQRLKALGNAIVPQVAEVIIGAIKNS